MSGYYLIIPAVIILIFMCPILLQVKATLNVEDMSGVVSVFIFRKKIIYFFYKIEGKKIILTNEDDAKEEEFDFSKRRGGAISRDDKTDQGQSTTQRDISFL